MYFESLPQKAERTLLRTAAAVRGVLPKRIETWEVWTGAFEKEGDARPLIDQIKKWSCADGPCLYVISRLTDSPSSEIVSRKFADAKDTDGDERRCYPRLNAPSSILYVGSSEKIHQRLKEHLGFGSKKTFSLQLAAWARQLDLALKICCAQYPADTPSEVLQALEDTLWFELKPMFGRQGAR